MSCGTSVLWPAASEETPTTWTSFSMAGVRLRRRLEERADVDIEADVGEGSGDDLGAAIVTVLAHFGHQDARTAAFFALEFRGHLLRGSGIPRRLPLRRRRHRRSCA